MGAKLIEPGTGGERTREIAIGSDEFLIGRGPDCDLRLPLSDISRHHCSIRLAHGPGTKVQATLTDLGSANGTFRNGQRVRGPVELHTGDEILMGPCRFLVDLGDGPGIDLGPVKPADPRAVTIHVPRGKAANE